MEDRKISYSGCCETAMKNVDSLPLAMAYVPWQTWGHIYKAEEALMQGTIFEELNQPFTGRRCSC